MGDRASDLGTQAGQITERAKERVGELGVGVRQRARDLGYTAKYRGRQARGGIQRLVEENPLAVAAGVVVLGLAAGLLVPESEREQRLMGPTRDDLVSRAQETARRVKDAAVEAGQELKETVREEVNERAPEVKAVVQRRCAVGRPAGEGEGRPGEGGGETGREGATAWTGDGTGMISR